MTEKSFDEGWLAELEITLKEDEDFEEPTAAFKPVKPPVPSLTKEQHDALDKARSWYYETKHPHFRLDGAAGTGKTFCLQKLLAELDTNFVLFTAPTNKAVKVLQQTLRRADIFSPCSTIYSALGLKMMPNGDVKELMESEKGHTKVDWRKYRLCVVDESSMLSKVLMPHLERIARLFNVRFIFVGDSAQLPPVNEPYSEMMKADYPPECCASLITVMRQDNQILTLASAIRAQVDLFIPRVSLANDNDGQEGVWLYNNAALADRAILQALDAGLFSEAVGAKCIAWRNITVDKLNMFIRSRLFPETSQFFAESDRVIVTEPFSPLIADIKGEKSKHFVTTDSEGRIENAELMPHPWYPDFAVWCLTVTGDEDELYTAYVLDTTDLRNKKRWDAYKISLANAAKIDRKQWPLFWQFVEAFNGVRHGYAITAHRSQGSTYKSAFVNFSDMLLNRNRQEAFRCLYVACTRPQKQLHLW